MAKYREKIEDRSVWITATPTQAALTLPFYITEAGHFYSEADYEVDRTTHDSYLFIYTLKGCGEVFSDNCQATLPPGFAVVIDCQKSHRYASRSDTWEFLWMHIKGGGARTIFDMLYPNSVFAINVENPEEFTAKIDQLIYKAAENDMLNAVESSVMLHDVFYTLISGSIKTEQKKSCGRYSEYVERAASLIHQKYSEPISIDAILSEIPLSKYHFIRVFKRIMGTTPYSYLTNHRINNAKFLLRSSDMLVSEIAEKCGFSDTSNFIEHFKKHTGQKPVEYRRYFSEA